VVVGHLGTVFFGHFENLEVVNNFLICSFDASFQALQFDASFGQPNTIIPKYIKENHLSAILELSGGKSQHTLNFHSSGMADPIVVIFNRDAAKIIFNAFCRFNVQCGKPVWHSMTWKKLVHSPHWFLKETF
jgi:hypothetical protein